jgi:tRNA 2-thiouridine synthesizing protein A
MAEFQLDARRLLCPMPVIRTQDKVKDLKQGDILEVVSTDPGAINDIPAWCRINGHEVLDIKNDNNEIFITIKIGRSR